MDDLRSKLHDAVYRKLDQMSNNDVIDFDSAEFSINYDNRVELDDINFNVDTLMDEVDEAINDVIEVFEETVLPEPTTETN